MAKATASQENARKEGVIVDYPLVTNVVMFKGIPAFLKATGSKLFTNDGTANNLANGDVFAGVTVEPANQADGDTYGRVYQEGLVLLKFTNTLSEDNVGDDVYVNNTTLDGAVTITAITGAPQCLIGKIAQFVNTSTAYVRINNAMFNKAATA